MNNGIQPITTDGKTSVILPFTPDQFQEFIAGLLGRPQTLEGRMVGGFAVTRENLIQLYHLIVQRVQQQNGAAPIQFIVKISYSDGSSVQLNSIEDFQNYNEVRDVVSKSVTLAWIYLIGFPGNAAPEKQEIEVSFLSARRDAIFDDFYFGTGQGIDYRISHTARTWGADLEGLIRSYIQGMMIKESAVRLIALKHSGKITAIVCTCVAMLLLAGMWLTFNHVSAAQLNTLKPVFGNAVPLAAKLDAALLSLAAGTWQKFSVASLIYLLVGVILTITAGIIVNGTLDTRRPSAVLLTPRAVEQYAALMSAYNGKIWTFILTCGGAIFLGVVTNIIYDFYCKNLAMLLLN